MHRRPTAAFGVFVRRQIRDVFLIWIRILCFAHFNWVSFCFCSQAAQRIWTAVRRWRTITGWLCGCLARLSAEHGSRPWYLSCALGHVLRPYLSFLCFLRSYYLSVC